MTHPVTQADRNAAAGIWGNDYTMGRGYSDGYWIRRGEYDHHHGVQSFAQHAVRAAERMRALCEQRAEYERELAQDNLNENYDPAFNRPAKETARKIATAIRALPLGGAEG